MVIFEKLQPFTIRLKKKITEKSIHLLKNIQSYHLMCHVEVKVVIKF